MPVIGGSQANTTIGSKENQKSKYFYGTKECWNK